MRFQSEIREAVDVIANGNEQECVAEAGGWGQLGYGKLNKR